MIIYITELLEKRKINESYALLTTIKNIIFQNFFYLKSKIIKIIIISKVNYFVKNIT